MSLASNTSGNTPVAKEEVLFIVEAIAEAEMQRRNTLAKRRLVVIGGHVANDGGAGYFWDTDTVAVNPQRLARMVWVEMLNAGKAPTRRLVAEQARGVITHEIVHAAQFEAARLAYSKIKGDKPAFKEWVRGYYEAIWNSLDSKQQQATIAAYGTILANAPEWQRGAEASRMLLETGTMERMSEAIIRHLENVLAVLKRWYDDVVNGKADNAIVADEIQRVQAVLDAWNSGGTVKPDAKKKPAKPKAQKPETPTKDGIIEMDDAGNYITQEPNGSFKVWRAGSTNASLAGTIGFKGEEGLRRAKERLAALTPSQAIPPATTQTNTNEQKDQANGQGQRQEVLVAPANPETAPRESELSNPDMGSAGAADGLPPIEKAPPGSPELAKPTIAADKHWLFDTQAGDVASMTEGRNVFIVAHFTKLKDAKDALAKINQGKDGPARIEAWLAKPKKEGGKVVSKWAVFIPNVTQDFVDEFNAIKAKDQESDEPISQPLPNESLTPAQFKTGDRVTWQSGGKTLTGTVRSLGDSRAEVDTDQIAHAGGVPIKRIETVPLHRLTLVQGKEPEAGAEEQRPYPTPNTDRVLKRLRSLSPPSSNDEAAARADSLEQAEIEDRLAFELAERLKAMDDTALAAYLKDSEYLAKHSGMPPVRKSAASDAAAARKETARRQKAPNPTNEAAQEATPPKSGASSASLDKLKNAFDGLASAPAAPARLLAVMRSLPDAVIGGDLGNLTGHPDYAAAKAGDNAAALRIAYDVVTPEFVQRVQAAIGDEKPAILPVIAVEQAGNNKIPLMAVHELAERLGLPVASGILQAAKVNRTASTGLDRVFKPVPFDGKVEVGQSYLLLDDTLTQGGTFAGLANHIVAGGGHVAGIVALTGKAYSAKLAPSPATLARLRETHGDIESSFQSYFGYGYDALTESEARYLANFRPADTVRTRILEAGHGTSQQVLSREQAEGLASAPAAQQIGLPKERRAAFLDVAESLISDGVNTPKALARALNEARPDGSLRKYSQALWNFFGTIDPALTGQHDWQAIYAEIDRPITQPLPNESLTQQPAAQPSFKVGDRVQANEGTGKIAELRGGQAKLTLDNGTMSLWIPVDRLQAVQEPVSPETPSGRFSARAKEEARQQFEGLLGSAPSRVDKSSSGGQSSPYAPGIDSPAQLANYAEREDSDLDREEFAAIEHLREDHGSQVFALSPRLPRLSASQTPREAESRQRALNGAGELTESLQAVFGKRILFVHRRGKPLPDDGYNPGKSRNILAVDTDSKQPLLYLVGHEMGHAIESQAPVLYNELSKAVLAMMADTSKYRAKLQSLGYDQSQEDAEIVNDFIGSQFMEPAFWRDLAGRDKSLFERVADFAIKFIQAILGRAATLTRDVRPFFAEIDKARALLVEVLTAYATDAKFPQQGALSGDLSRSTSGMKQQPIPADRLPGFIKLAQTLIAEGIRTPQDLAAFMEETFPGGKARPFSQALWNAIGMVSPDLSSTPDWQAVYAELDQVSARPPSVEGVPGPSSEQGAAPATSAADPVRELILSPDSRAKKAQAMKKLAEERGETLKQTQEYVESRLVQIADEVAREDWRTPQDRFEELVGIYDKQPLFSARTSTSMENQAYSTPAPMAFALRHMTGVTPQTSVYDATAGNGMLAIGSDLKNSVANEIDETRLEGLRRLGIGTITTQDATDTTGAFQNRPKAQTVHLNPPFGGIPNVNFDGYGIRKLEHIISLQALKEGMADNGTAAIILGATMNNQEQVKGAQWVFENYLYAHYNVVDNFEVSGELYGNQGAKWPVRILVIAGKKAVPTRNQDLAPKTVDRLDTWPDVWARAERTRYEVERQRQTLGTDGQTTAPSGNPAGNIGTADTRPIPDSQRPAASTSSGSGVRGGNAGGQPRPGATGTGGSGLAAPGATEQPADAGTSVQPATGGRKPAASVGGRGGRRPSSAANAPSGSSQTGGATDASGQNPANAGSVTPRTERRKAAATATQVAYDPASNGSPFETLVPRGIGESLQTALAEIVANRGPIDQYVADRLDMSVEDLHKAMAAEQIDGVAMAIYQMETGGALIIGDETGIGKGRQAASLIRYAILQGKIPVFFTKDPKLFSDMWGDLKDIGTTVSGPNVSASDMSVRPLILGDSEKAQIKTPDNVVVLKPASNARQSTVFAAARQNGFASTGHNAIFSTYSQIRDPNARQEFLEWLAANDDVVVVLDEAHESAGDGETSMQAAFMMGGTVKRGKGSSKTEITKSGLLNGAGAMHPRGGVLYLSATFAKRPDNMPVYFRTDLRKGADKFSQVVEAMDKGGVALQQAITEALAEAGQYTRRERDFTGVSYAMKQVTVRNEAELVRQVDAVTGVLSAIANFSKLIRAAVEDSTARTDSQSSMTDFASIVHNQVSQLLLAAKADAVVDEVVEAHKRGEKPIVALMNTMESFLSQYVDDMNIKPGQPMKLNWAALLEYALSRTLRASEKLPNGDTVIYTVDPAEHGLGMAYQRVLSAARAVNVAFPVSPIDYIIQKARAGGVEVGELTGRESGIDYTNFQTGEGTYRKFKRADKNTLVNTFNNGSLAGMLLNASGSTGLSIHAAAKFKDQKPRHMIIAQPALDINVFIQTLGRIKRTGIVLLGRYPDGSAYGARYSHLTLPLNSELRPAIMAARKMKSLNANTTGESDSAVKIEAEDLMNRFGNQVVAEYLSRNPELQDALNIEVEEKEDGTVVAPKDIARKFTGRMALQPNKVQGEAYAEIISDYRRAIEQAKVTGDYDLEIIVHEDWDATRAASEQIVAGTDESSIFTSSVNVEAWDMTDNRPTPSGADMVAEFTKENGSREQLDARWQDFSKQVDERLDSLEQRLRQRLTEAKAQVSGMSPDDPAFKGLEREVASLERNLSGVAVKKARWRDTQRRLDDIIDEAGRPVMLENAETQEMDHGMLTQIRFPDITGQLRIAPSAFKMTYLLNRPGGRIYPTLAQFKQDGYTQARSQYSLDDMTGDRGGRRERRTLLVGSPIRAYGATGGKGKVVRFKARDGSLVTGILMPRSWNISNLAEDPRKELADAGAVEKYMRDLGWTPGFVESGDSVRIHAANGTFRISAPSARRTGGEIFLDDQLREIVGDFFRNGQRMTARIDSISDVPRVAARVMQLTGKRFKGQDVARVRKANGVDENADMDSPVRTAKPKSAVKAAATEAWNRYLEQGGSSPVNQISRDQWLNRIDQEEGRSLSSAPAPTFRRAKDFSYSGIYEVDTPGGVKRAFRDPETKAWLNPDVKTSVTSPLPYELLGWTKEEALQKLLQPMPRDRAEAIVRNLTPKEQAGKLNPKEREALTEARSVVDGVSLASAPAALPLTDVVSTIENLYSDPSDPDHWPEDVQERYNDDPLKVAIDDGDFLTAWKAAPEDAQGIAVLADLENLTAAYQAQAKASAIHDRIWFAPFDTVLSPAQIAEIKAQSTQEEARFKTALFRQQACAIPSLARWWRK